MTVLQIGHMPLYNIKHFWINRRTAGKVNPEVFFIAQPFIVSGSSMDPTFENGEYLIVDELSYRFDEPARGDVVIFRFPRDPKKFFIKRIIGLPGETIRIRHDTITITNEENPGGLVLDEPYTSSLTAGNKIVDLSDTEYYVLGDNRSSSSDSRIWGPLGEDFIVGRAFMRLLPISETGFFPGEFDYINSNSK